MKRLFTLSLLLFAGPIHGQTADFVDNTNSEGLSSMQRAILKEDITRMEGLIKNGAGYYWEDESEKTPLINYVISNTKPKAMDFLLTKQTVVDYSSVETAMQQSNYTLVKKFIDQNYLRAFRRTNIITESREATGRYSNIVTDIEPYEVYTTNWTFVYTLTNRIGVPAEYTLDVKTNTYPNPKEFALQASRSAIIPYNEYISNWRFTYTLTNRKGVPKEYGVDAGSNTYENPEEQIRAYVLAQNQKGGLYTFASNISRVITNTLRGDRGNAGLVKFSSNISLIITNIITTKTQQEAIFQTRVKTNQTYMLLPFELDKTNLSGLAQIAVKQNSLPMLQYLIDKGAEANEKNLLHHAVATFNKEMVVYLLSKGADPLKYGGGYFEIYKNEISDHNYSGTAFSVASQLKADVLEKISSLEDSIKLNKSKIIEFQQTLLQFKKGTWGYDIYSRHLKEQQESLAKNQKDLPLRKKDLPQITEIYEILKKHEE